MTQVLFSEVLGVQRPSISPPRAHTSPRKEEPKVHYSQDLWNPGVEMSSGDGNHVKLLYGDIRPLRPHPDRHRHRRHGLPILKIYLLV